MARQSSRGFKVRILHSIIKFGGPPGLEKEARELLRYRLLNGFPGTSWRGLNECPQLRNTGFARTVAAQISRAPRPGESLGTVYQAISPKKKTFKIQKSKYVRHTDAIGRKYYVPREGGQRVTREVYEKDQLRVAKYKKRILAAVERRLRAPKIIIKVVQLDIRYRDRDGEWLWWVSIRRGEAIEDPAEPTGEEGS